MKRITTALLLAVAVYFSGCSKSNVIQTVSGTINGYPALTLYGSSGKPTDYVLLSTKAGDKEISYHGVVYPYYYVSASTDIFIAVSSVTVVRATLDNVSPKTMLTIVSTPQSSFGSTLYTAK